MEKIIYNILNKINKNGYEAFIVGGYVRDKILFKKSTDIDICTIAKPKEIMKILKDYSPKSTKYGNVEIYINNYSFEITTYRKEISYIDNRKPDKIEYIKSLEEDLKRRDFTINTICMSKEGKIIDKLNGKKDLKNKLIKSVSDPYKEINEDALRILRAIRFATKLNFKIDDELKKAIIKNKGLLKNLSITRKKDELNKIFSNKNKKYGISLIRELKLEEELDLKNIDCVLLTNNLIGIWASITDIDYNFTKVEKEAIKNIKCLMEEEKITNELMYKYGAYTLSIICDLKDLNKRKMLSRYEKLPIKDKNDIQITNDEICALLNKEPSSFLKEIFNDIEKQIINLKLKNKNKDIKAYILKKYMV